MYLAEVICLYSQILRKLRKEDHLNYPQSGQHNETCSLSYEREKDRDRETQTDSEITKLAITLSK